MGTPEFPDLGEHCSVEDCNVLDFLPFRCDVCKQTFCLEHRSYNKHHCPNAADKDVTVLVCPLCAKAVRLLSKEDPNVTWDRHVRTDCDPSNYAKVHKKPRCPVRGCREVLTASNKMVCKECKQEVCLKHRFGLDHDCKGRAKIPNRGSWFATTFFQSHQGKAVGKNLSSNLKNDSVKTGWTTATSLIKSSAESSVVKLNNFASTMFSVIGGTSSASQEAEPWGLQTSKSPSGANELCPQCGAQFTTLSLLIQHVERYHGTNVTQEAADICPKCERSFTDPISLVNHVEKDHGGSSLN